VSLPRLVLLHGFTQTGRSFAPLLPELCRHFDVVAPDLPGHATRSSMPAGPGEAARIVAEEGGRGFYLGYSMGGRIALRLALDRPDLVEGLILVSTTAGIEDPEERAARGVADEAMAASLEAEGLDPFLERWLAQPLFAGLPPQAAGLEARRANTAEGLAGALRLMGQGAFGPVWPRLPELRMPVLVMAGEHDDAYCQHALRLGGWIGETAVLAMVPGAGHACHLERPEAFLELLVRFLTEHRDDHA
jgi:2-succinyl-6-hydroxy-2,4-cyclohexadiene-1-carboxylate synthase